MIESFGCLVIFLAVYNVNIIIHFKSISSKYSNKIFIENKKKNSNSSNWYCCVCVFFFCSHLVHQKFINWIDFPAQWPYNIALRWKMFNWSIVFIQFSHFMMIVKISIGVCVFFFCRALLKNSFLFYGDITKYASTTVVPF